MTVNKITLLTPADMVQWGTPKVLEKGAKDIILHGNPGKSENYVFRFALPKDFEIKPFIVTASCFLTVIEGDILIGEGDKVIKNAMSPLPAGSFCFIPADCPIYFITHKQVTLQFHGVGPIDIKYLSA